MLSPVVDIELFLKGEGSEKLLGDDNSDKISNVSILYRVEFYKDFQGYYDELIKSKTLLNIPFEF